MVNFIQHKRYWQALANPPILSSDRAGWQGLYLEYRYDPAGELPEHAFEHCHVLCVETLHRPCVGTKWLNGQFQEKCIVKGDVFVVPEYVPYRERWDGDIEYISLFLDSTFVKQIADESTQLSQVEILPHFPKPDPLIYQIGLALKTSLEQGINDPLYAETMATALAVHLLQYYSAQPSILKPERGGLSPSRLKQVQQYIDARLDQELSLIELANLVHMSSHHFARLFKRSTGISPHRYVIQRRVERAQQLLSQGELAIADIAQRVGFANQSHLSRHFKRLLGVTPKQWMG